MRSTASRGPARRLHALEQHAQPLSTRILLIADGLRGRPQALLEVDVVHRLAGGEAVPVAQQVAQPQLERAHAQPLGEHVHRALARPHRLGRAVAAERAVGRQVRVDGERVDAHVGNPVGPDARVAHLAGDPRPAVGVGAGVGPAVELLRDERPVARRTDPHAHNCGVAPERDELLGAVEHRLDGPPRLARQAGDDRLEARERLGAERPAHRRRQHADPLRFDTEDAGQVVAQVEGGLGARGELEPAIGRPLRERGVRLHRRVLGPGGAERLLDDHVGIREGALGITVEEPEAVADVRPGQWPHTDRHGVAGRAAALRMEERRPLGNGRERVEDGGQLRVAHAERARGGARSSRRRRRHRRDDVAHEARRVREHVLVLQLAAVASEVHGVLRKQRHRAGRQRRRVDGQHTCVGVRRAHEGRVPHAVRGGITGVADEPHPSSSSARRTSTAITRRR